MQAKGREAKGLRKKIATAAKEAGLSHHLVSFYAKKFEIYLNSKRK